MKYTALGKKRKSILMASALVFSLLISPASTGGLCLFGSLGILFSFMIRKSCIKRKLSFNGENGKLALLETVLSCLLLPSPCYKLVSHFVESWSASSLFSSYPPLLLLCGVLLTVFSLPFLLLIVSRLVIFVVNVFRLIPCKAIIAKISEARIRNIFRTFLVIIGSIFFSVIVAALLLVLAYKLPVDRMERNVRASAGVFEWETTYPDLFSWCNSQLDNYTDAIMLLEAADRSDGSPLERAMMAYRGRISDHSTPDQDLIEHYLYEKEFIKTEIYPRYWHGYHIILKPLLILMDYHAIRNLNRIVQFVLVVVISILMYRQNLRELIAPYWLSYLVLMPVVLGKSFQFSSCFYIMSFGVLALLLFRRRAGTDFVNYIFLYIGIATAFFDFLTYPIAAFGVPCVLYLYLNSDNSLEDKLVKLFKVSFFWCCGYAGMWISKWIVGSLTTDVNVVKNAAESILLRTSSVSPTGDEQYHVSEVLLRNIKAFTNTPFIVFALYWLFAVIKFIVHFVKSKSTNYCAVMNAVFPYLLVGVLPLIWYIFATNHSAMHFWFTNKALVVTLLALLFGSTELNQIDLSGSVKSEAFSSEKAVSP